MQVVKYVESCKIEHVAHFFSIVYIIVFEQVIVSWI